MIVAVPYNAADQARAERLMDCCFWISGQKPQGHILLAAGSDVHAEYKRKVKISAELAFFTVDVIQLKDSPGTKPEQISNVLRQVAKYVQDCYDKPWLYMEADCVPLKPTWLTDLFSAYSLQPKRYFGKYIESDGSRRMARTGIYPGDFYKDAGTKISVATTDLIHIEKWKEGMTIPASAVLLNGDRTGQLIEQLIEAAPVATTNTVAKRRGRPKRIVA